MSPKADDPQISDSDLSPELLCAKLLSDTSL